jgi:hypothetical protein
MASMMSDTGTSRAPSAVVVLVRHDDAMARHVRTERRSFREWFAAWQAKPRDSFWTETSWRWFLLVIGALLAGFVYDVRAGHSLTAALEAIGLIAVGVVIVLWVRRPLRR